MKFSEGLLLIVILSKKLRYILFILIALIVTLIIIQSIRWTVRTVYPIHYNKLIEKHAKNYDIDPYLVAAIIRNESKFNRYAVSQKESRGLMQIAPVTGRWASEMLEIENYSEDRLFEPDLNIQIGCWYLNMLNNEFNNNLVLVITAYNAGSGNVKKWLRDPQYSRNGKQLDEIPFMETKIYLKKVLRDYRIYKRVYE